MTTPTPTSTSMPAPKKEEAVEIVLPSGRFCRARSLYGYDWVKSEQICKGVPEMYPGFVLATLCITLDDRPVTYDELMGMDLRDVMPIIKVIGNFMAKPIR